MCNPEPANCAIACRAAAAAGSCPATPRAGRRSSCGFPECTACRSSIASESRCCTSGDRARGIGSLQREPDREQPLDDVVVQVSRDPVPVGQYIEFTHPALRRGQLPGKRRLVGERGHHL